MCGLQAQAQLQKMQATASQFSSLECELKCKEHEFLGSIVFSIAQDSLKTQHIYDYSAKGFGVARRKCATGEAKLVSLPKRVLYAISPISVYRKYTYKELQNRKI